MGVNDNKTLDIAENEKSRRIDEEQCVKCKLKVFKNNFEENSKMEIIEMRYESINRINNSSAYKYFDHKIFKKIKFHVNVFKF